LQDSFFAGVLVDHHHLGLTLDIIGLLKGGSLCGLISLAHGSNGSPTPLTWALAVMLVYRTEQGAAGGRG
jgi:hypothetical protein